MKKWFIPIIVVGAIIIAVVLGKIKFETPEAVAQVAGGQKYGAYYSVNTADASSGVTVWATSTDERFTIHTMLINGPVAMEVQLLDGSDEITTYYYGANGGSCPIYDLRSSTKGNDLSIKSNAAGQICVTVVGDSLWY